MEQLPRPIPAPAKDGKLLEWLTKRELVNALDLGSERTLDRMIEAGQFPRGTPWDGKELRWRWWAVVWFALNKDVAPLLRVGPIEEPPPEEPEAGRKDAGGRK